MTKKSIAGLSIALFSILFVLTNHLMEYLNIGVFFDLTIGIILLVLWVASLNYIFKKYKIAGYDDKNNLSVDFYPIEDVADHVLKYTVIMAKHNGKWIFGKHQDRSTWEIPGGRREKNEEIIKTAERELIEETGAMRFELTPICVYSVTTGVEKSYGLLCYAEILELGNLLEWEIVEIKAFEELPNELTYPLIQPQLYKKINDYLANLDC